MKTGNMTVEFCFDVIVLIFKFSLCMYVCSVVREREKEKEREREMCTYVGICMPWQACDSQGQLWRTFLSCQLFLEAVLHIRGGLALLLRILCVHFLSHHRSSGVLGLRLQVSGLHSKLFHLPNLLPDPSCGPLLWFDLISHRNIILYILKRLRVLWDFYDRKHASDSGSS